MKVFRVAVVALLVVSPLVISAQSVRLRLGSVLPANSLWDQSLKRMASDWQRATDGRVRLQVRATSGDEATLLRRMRMNNPQVAALSPLGLSEIDEAFGIFGIPFFFRSDAEAVAVLEALTPRLRDTLADNGLVLLNWGSGGWAHIFSAASVRSLDDLRQTKIFTAAGDDGMVRWYKENGFQPVPLALTDVLMGLNTGLIDAYPSSAYAALVYQWYRQTSYMLDVPLAPLVGATVMTERAWAGVGEADRAAMLEVAAATQASLFDAVARQDREAVQEMRTRGLTVTEVNAAAEATFRAEAERLTASWRGRMVPAEVYDAAVAARAAHRGE